MGIFDNAKISLPCECGKVTKKAVGSLRKKPEYECSCGRIIEVRGSFADDMKSVDKTVADTKRFISGLSKRR